ncbi:MAG TPA: biopolymer transporter ExbD, partial [Steroidobacteraceae bacterium]|nr:biopolymer transporter ExbD [Steroidobacteraceae bacterium]
MVEPNVIPLVDIMLVLLIIMIITVPVMTHAVKI